LQQLIIFPVLCAFGCQIHLSGKRVNQELKRNDVTWASMSASRIVPVFLLVALGLAALVHGLIGKKNQTFAGVIVQDGATYEFYQDAKDCNYRGTPYVLLPNSRFDEIVTTSGGLEHLDRLFHGRWRAKLNGNLSAVGWHKYRKNYWRELSVNYVVDAVEMSCGDSKVSPTSPPFR
jgi:hypothetical protein